MGKGLRTRALARRTVSMLLAACLLGAASLVNISPAAAAGTPLLAIGLDVASATSTTATYKINLRNAGNGDANNVRVFLPVPPKTTFESSSPETSPVDGNPGGAPTCDNAGTREPATTSCQWFFGTLAPGSERDITVVLNLLTLTTDPTPSSPDVIQPTASVQGINPGTGAALNASDTDDSLKRVRLVLEQDTWVNTTEPTNTNHGACPTLTVRGGSQVTAFVDTDTALPAATTIETFQAAMLLANVAASDYSEASPGTLEVRAITGGEWSPGAGLCGGGTLGSGDQVRTGSLPNTAATATSATTVRGVGPIQWDVTSDLDGPVKRAAFQGWQIRNTTGSGSLDVHSADAVDAMRPRMLLIYTAPETSRCIDVDPESSVSLPTSEPILTARVTDGGARLVSGTMDACNGTPVPGQSVRWQVEGPQIETPDVYISNRAGTLVPKTGTTDAGPEDEQTTTDQTGATFIGIRLANTSTFNGENRVSGLVGTDTGAEPETCTVQQQLQNACPTGEDNPPRNEDDVKLQWSTTGPSAEPTSTPTPTPSQTPTQTPSSTPTSPRPTNSGSPSGSPSGSVSASGLSPVQLSLTSSQETAVAGTELLLTGELSSDNPACAQPGTTIELIKRDAEATEFTHLANVDVRSNQLFEFAVAPQASTFYGATVAAHGACDAGVATPITVLVAPEMTIRSTVTSVPRGKRFWITGKMLPEHQLSPVTLWRKIGPGEWDRIAKAYLSAESKYSFAVRYVWKRARSVFVVRWRATDADHASAKSAPLRITRAS